MFSLEQLNGQHLPDKTICITFDDGPGETVGDGPGPKTMRLAEFLHDEKIPATFFMVGQFIEQYPMIVKQVHQLGFRIGNHSYSHPDMLALFNKELDFITEIERTNQSIRDLIHVNQIPFRAPYGSWSSEMSVCANKLLSSEVEITGPFSWDILANDWDFWQQGKTAAECAEAYMTVIKDINHGIFLMHDSTLDLEVARVNNRTFETMKIIIPALQQNGFQFVGLDAIPSV
jgi:peptidoglycan/xylan/chitin deacetylase (PgdA/CDA1 family)